MKRLKVVAFLLTLFCVHSNAQGFLEGFLTGLVDGFAKDNKSSSTQNYSNSNSIANGSSNTYCYSNTKKINNDTGVASKGISGKNFYYTFTSDKSTFYESDEDGNLLPVGGIIFKYKGTRNGTLWYVCWKQQVKGLGTSSFRMEYDWDETIQALVSPDMSTINIIRNVDQSGVSIHTTDVYKRFDPNSSSNIPNLIE